MEFGWANVEQSPFLSMSAEKLAMYNWREATPLQKKWKKAQRKLLSQAWISF